MKLGSLVLLALACGCAPAGDSNAQGSPAREGAPAAAAGKVGDGPRLALPIACVVGQSCEVQNYVDRDPGPGARDYRCAAQTYQAHGGVDIRLLDMAAQRAGVNVLAAAPGRVARLRDGVADISVKAAGAPALNGQDCGNGVVIDHGEGWETQYCHLAKGSVAVTVGQAVESGQPIAKVGLSGNTEYPHLHLTVRKAGTVVDPFAPDLAPEACDAGAAGAGLWRPEAAQAMAYKAGAVLNAGFAAGPITMEAIEAGGVPTPDAGAPALVAYGRAINLQGGDIVHLTIVAPDGAELVSSSSEPMNRAKAQQMMFAGKRAPAGGWPPGSYAATFTIRRGNEAVAVRRFSLSL